MAKSGISFVASYDRLEGPKTTHAGSGRKSEDNANGSSQREEGIDRNLVLYYLVGDVI
jgi:hypothetical protein